MTDEFTSADQLQIRCPSCGGISTVPATETLHPKFCATCRHVHVGQWNVGAGTDTVPTAQPQSDDPEATAARTGLGQIGRYCLETILGSGTFGVVYKAWDPALGRTVAIKVPRVDPMRRRSQDLLNEARLAAQVHHPRIVSIFDTGEVNGHPYIVTEFVEGDTLANVLKKGPLGVKRAVRVVYELAQALQFAHRRDLVHRDVKPGNVMLDRQGLPRLMDFGLACRPDDARSGTEGTLVGTPAYMSPEQARGQHSRVGPASDQYSLGVLLFESLTGRRPYLGAIPSIIRQIANDPPPRLNRINPDLPPELDRICERMMSLSIENRYPNLQAVATELAEFLRAQSDSTSVPIPSPMPRPPSATPGDSAQATTPSSRLSTVTSGPALGEPATTRPVRWRLMSAGLVSLVVLSPIVIWQTAGFLRSTEAPSPNPPTVAPVSAMSTVPTSTPEAPAAIEVAAPPQPEAMPAAAPVPKRIVIPIEVGEAVDALHPANAEALAAPADLLAEDAGPAYPEIVPDDPAQTEAFQKGYRTFLKQAFPERNSRIDKDRNIDKARYQELLQQYSRLKAQAPREPRLDLAMALIEKSYFSVDAKSKGKPRTTELLRSATAVGGYPFVPAYQTLIDQLIAEGKFDQAATAVQEVAAALAVPSEFPSRNERQRAVLWLGQLHGYYASGIDSATSQYEPLLEGQDALASKLPDALKELFVGAIADVTSEIAAKAQDLSAEEAAEIQMNAQKNLDKLGQIVRTVDDLKKLQEMKQQENETLEDQWTRLLADYQQKVTPIIQQLQSLKIQFDAASNDLALQEQLRQSAYAQFQEYQARVSMGDPPNPALANNLQHQITQAESNVQSIRSRQNAIGALGQQKFAEGQNIDRQYVPVLQGIAQKVKINQRDQEKLVSLGRELNRQRVRANPVQPVKASTKVRKKKRELANVREWVSWDVDEARIWLIKDSSRDHDAPAP